jgi:hypothetical protein
MGRGRRRPYCQTNGSQNDIELEMFPRPPNLVAGCNQNRVLLLALTSEISFARAPIMFVRPQNSSTANKSKAQTDTSRKSDRRN